MVTPVYHDAHRCSRTLNGADYHLAPSDLAARLLDAAHPTGDNLDQLRGYMPHRHKSFRPGSQRAARRHGPAAVSLVLEIALDALPAHRIADDLVELVTPDELSRRATQRLAQVVPHRSARLHVRIARGERLLDVGVEHEEYLSRHAW